MPSYRCLKKTGLPEITRCNFIKIQSASNDYLIFRDSQRTAGLNCVGVGEQIALSPSVSIGFPLCEITFPEYLFLHFFCLSFFPWFQSPVMMGKSFSWSGSSEISQFGTNLSIPSWC